MARIPRLIRFDTAAYVLALAGPMLLAAGFMANHRCEDAADPGIRPETPVKLVAMPVPVPRAVAVPQEVKVPVVVAPTVREGAVGSAVLVHDGRLVFTTDVQDEWATGPVTADPEFKDDLENVRAIRALDRDALNPELVSALSGSYDVYGRDGKVCTTTVNDPHLAAEYFGWESYDELWEVWDDYDEEPSPAAIAKAVKKVRPKVWKNEERWLVAELPEECEGGLWARHSTLPDPELLEVTHGNTSESRKAFKKLLASEDMQMMQGEFEAFRADEMEEGYEEFDVPWTKFTRKTRNVHNWSDASGEVKVVSVESGAYEICSAFYFYDGVTYFTGGDAFEDIEFVGMPTAVFDADGDGRYERIVTGEYGVTLTDGHGDVRSAEVYLQGCPC